MLLLHQIFFYVSERTFQKEHKKINDNLRDEKLQHDIKEEARISALSLGKIDKYESKKKNNGIS